jgi:carboxyl-terminal processing protease
MRFELTLCLTLLLFSPIPSFGVGLTNGSFEIVSSPSTLPDGWMLTSPGVIATSDAAVKHNGERSIRIERGTGPSFSGVAQAIEPTELKGKLVVFSAQMRSQNTIGGNVGVWIRQEGPNSSTVASSFHRPLTSQNEWALRRVVLAIPKDTTRLMVAVINGGTGLVWADSVALDVIQFPLKQKMSKIAEAYLDSALEHLRATALSASSVDWETASHVAKCLADGAQQPAETYEAIEYLVNQLRDSHSHFVPPDRANQLRSASAPSARVQSRMFENIGIITIPTFATLSKTASSEFVNSSHTQIEELSKKSVCGWVVDLRQNSGGNMYPMIGALSPFLPDGTFGFFISKSGKHAWGIIDETVYGGLEPLGLPRDKDKPRHSDAAAPIAVLIGRRTASSGEALAISLAARQSTRFFGTTTAGLTTSNQTTQLSDGAILAITTSRMADRRGNVLTNGVTPDVVVAPDLLTPTDDSTLKAAMDWLHETPTCRATRLVKGDSGR